MDNEFIIFRRDSCPVIPGSFFLFRFRCLRNCFQRYFLLLVFS